MDPQAIPKRQGDVNLQANSKKRVGMIAGGSGITPMIQLINQILSNPEDSTQVDLLFANRAEEDILLKSQLDDLARTHATFRVHYVLSQPASPPGSSWTGLKGQVDANMISALMPSPSRDALIYVCGPPGEQ